jgi:adenylate kinase family enzyme
MSEPLERRSATAEDHLKDGAMDQAGDAFALACGLRLRHVLVMGASGAGVTTLGLALAGALGVRHVDTDEYLWLQTEPPFTRTRKPTAHLRLVQRACGKEWVISGSLYSWGDPLIPLLDLAVFVDTPTPVRLARLGCREEQRFGATAIAPGGWRHAEHIRFLEWAAGYDDGTASHNRQSQEAWLAAVPCPVLRLDGCRPTAALVEEILAFARKA